MTKYEETIEILNNMAKVKMTMNSHKGSIELNKPKVVLQQAFDELKELEQALLSDEDVELMHVIEEAADVQNFLIAIVHQQIEKYRSRK